jgi:hypothetical protein
MTAVVEAVSADAPIVLVRHEDVPGLMDRMSSMALFAPTREVLASAGLHPGDRARFTLRQLPDRLEIVEIQKIR